MNDEQNMIIRLQIENAALRRENKTLRTLLEHHGITWKEPVHNTADTRNQLIEKRLALYKSYFRGRQDVYAKRWFGKDGKKNYGPVIRRECKKWNPSRRRYELSPIPGESAYEPLTDEILIRHLSVNDDSYGLYVVVNDDECFLAVIDFDGDRWKDEVSQFIKVVDTYHFPYLIERSQSGNGGHLWFFFEQALKAKKARQFCSTLITLCMEHLSTLHMKAYDRIFPTQDRVTKNGFGNLIALPLEGSARTKGNTLFLNRNLQACENPWDMLQNTRKIHEDKIDIFLNQAGASFDTGKLGIGSPLTILSKEAHVPLLESSIILPIMLQNGIHIPMEDLSSHVINKLKRIASFKNPEFYKAQRMRLSTWNKPRIICCVDKSDDGQMILPRGCLEAIQNDCSEEGISVQLTDQRYVGQKNEFNFIGQLREEQQVAVDAMLQHDCGILSAPTGFGKTIISTALISKINTNTLIIVHTKPLLDQWLHSIRSFVMEKNQPVEVGILGGGKNTLTGCLDIALINSLAQEDHIDVVTNYGMIIVDECHHVAAVSYEKVLKTVRAKHVYGLTATPIRYDGHHDIIFMQCGPVIYQVNQTSSTTEHELKGTVSSILTLFRCDYQQMEIQQIYEALTKDAARNHLIVEDIRKQVLQKRSILVLSTRLEQLKLLHRLLEAAGLSALIMSGSQPVRIKREVTAYLRRMKEENLPVLILSTGKYIGEGFDFPKLDTLVFASPIAWKGNVIQYVGRVSRVYKDKRDVLIIDYIDFKIPVLVRMFSKRLNAYHKIGFSVADRPDKPFEKLLFSSGDYGETLQKDLYDSPGPIVFSVPYVLPNKVRYLLKLITELAKNKKVFMLIRNVQNTLQAEEVEQLYRQLETSGITFKTTEQELPNCILIGNRIVWYGSIHLFGKIEKDDTMLRLDDPTYLNDFSSVVNYDSA